MKSSHYLILAVVIIVVGVAIYFNMREPRSIPQPLSTEITYVGENAENMIRVTSPAPGALITSPLTITGEARGGWYFEASFPIYLTNWDGKIIAEGFATAQGDWKTEEFVPFTAILTFEDPSYEQEYSHRGSLILHNANASGDSIRDKALEFNVRFR